MKDFRYLFNSISPFSKKNVYGGEPSELEARPFNLLQIIESCFDFLAEPARGKQLAFYCCVMSELPPQVCGDAGRVRQILYNLMAYAIKSTAAGTVALNVSGQLEGDDRILLSFTLYDTTKGGDAALMSQLPNQTSQTDATPVQDCDFGHEGVELIISRQLIERMQGDIDMQSLSGEGTIWRFEIGLGRLPAHDAPGAPLPFDQLHMLYVDSSELNRRLLVDQFTFWGMMCTASTDADSTFSALSDAIQQENPFPLVVIRHDPPTLDGYTLCRDIRQSEMAATTKILLLTSVEEGPLHLASSAPLCDATLIFPIQAHTLCRVLQQLVEKSIDTVPAHEPTPSRPADQELPNAVMNILLVEDNRVNQQVALSMLRKWGHRIDVAWNGLEALAAVQQQGYDLVLMDIQMPEMDGVTATQRIRQLDGPSASVPIVAVTANAMQGDRERFLEAGIDDYIAKPIDRDIFHRVVHRYAPQEGTVPSERPEEKSKLETSTPLIGHEVLSYLLSELSGETVSELIDEYMTHSTDLLSQALVASEDNDAKNVEYAVHTLKGMSGALGALRMVDICQHILEACRNQGTQQIELHMDGLSGTTEETQQALQAWRSEHESC